eukprot:scaffold7962_cov67-Skeletonema_dohrnii-CCMP3373.AAC.2
MLANNILKNNQVLSYFILTFIISWGAILCIVGPNGLPAASEEYKQAIGLGLLLGPSMAAFILTAVLEGREGFRGLLPITIINLRQIKDSSSCYYAIALLIAPLSSVVTLIMLSTLVSEAYTPKLFTSTDKPSLVLTGISVGYIIATFEEIGWSGYAVPRLLQIHGVLQTGVITGVIWGLWHFPPFWKPNEEEWCANDVILMHTSLVFCMIAIEPPLHGSDLLMYILTWTVVLWLVVWLGASCCKSDCTHDKGP